MTKEEIEKAAVKRWRQRPCETVQLNRIEAIDFALEMVRRHNDELQAEFNSQWVIDIIKARKP